MQYQTEFKRLHQAMEKGIEVVLDPSACNWDGHKYHDECVKYLGEAISIARKIEEKNGSTVFNIGFVFIAQPRSYPTVLELFNSIIKADKMGNRPVPSDILYLQE